LLAEKVECPAPVGGALVYIPCHVIKSKQILNVIFFSNNLTKHL
jgi:hypothetical protein